MAATTLYQANSSVLTSKDIASLYSRTFDRIVQQSESVEAEGARFFAEEMGNLETFKIGEVSSALDLPIKATDTDRVPIFQPLEGHNKTVTAVQRRSGIMVTKDAIKSQKTRMLAGLMIGLPNSVKQSQEYAYASVWNGGAATNTGADGSFLFADDHTLEDTRAGSWSNVSASGAAFDTGTLFTAWLNMQHRTNAKGFPKRQKMTAVYYPDDLQEAVSKVHNSTLYPQNSLNAKLDPLFSAWEMVPSLYLRDGSTTAWYCIGDNAEADRGLIIYWQTKPEYEALNDGLNPRLIMGRSVTLSFAVDSVHGRSLYRNAGA